MAHVRHDAAVPSPKTIHLTTRSLPCNRHPRPSRDVAVPMAPTNGKSLPSSLGDLACSLANIVALDRPVCLLPRRCFQNGFQVGRLVYFKYPMLAPSLNPIPARIGAKTTSSLICSVMPTPPTTKADPATPPNRE